MIKIVLDTNVLVSATIVANGPSARILDAVRHGKLALITSSALLAEFADVITRPHIVRKYPLVAQQADAVLDGLRALATLTPASVQMPTASPDPDDNVVLACAEHGQADYIVSGDPHLFELGRYRDIPILRPQEFVAQVLDTA